MFHACVEEAFDDSNDVAAVSNDAGFGCVCWFWGNHGVMPHCCRPIFISSISHGLQAGYSCSADIVTLLLLYSDFNTKLGGSEISI
jgi:hypothetical protein